MYRMGMGSFPGEWEGSCPGEWEWEVDQENGNGKLTSRMGMGSQGFIQDISKRAQKVGAKLL